LEALAEQVAQWLLQRYPLQHVELDVTKPGALKQAKSVAVRIVRYAEPKQSASQ
jgi:dihydroneopterin aldolase